MKKIALKEIHPPAPTANVKQVAIREHTIAKRKNNTLAKMQEKGYDSLVIYADKEHYQNFYYFTGFMPRFEEGLFVLHQDGTSYLILGNENMKMESFSRSASQAILYSGFSLPNQPDYAGISLEEALGQAGIKGAQTVGLAGWKLFKDTEQFYDVPHFIVEALRSVVGDVEKIRNATELLVNPHDGVRTVNNANEVAYFEYGATLASNGLLRAYQEIEREISETKLAELLESQGQPSSVVTIAAGKDRFKDAYQFPRQQPIQEGDPVSLTVGYTGGLSSRKGIMSQYEDLAEEDRKFYLDNVLTPYFTAFHTWLKNIKIGMAGEEMYQLIESQLHHMGASLELNPGHLTAEEEWMSTPVYKDSQDKIRSGMIFQVDILMINPHGSVSAEDGVLIADRALQEQLQIDYPHVWARMQERRRYLAEEVGLSLPDIVLPMSNALAYFKPYLLSRHAVVFE